MSVNDEGLVSMFTLMKNSIQINGEHKPQYPVFLVLVPSLGIACHSSLTPHMLSILKAILNKFSFIIKRFLYHLKSLVWEVSEKCQTICVTIISV